MIGNKIAVNRFDHCGANCRVKGTVQKIAANSKSQINQDTCMVNSIIP
jgi:hypothetical protein